jgi:cystathionine beta-lyase family protein involved in aluminum resistance
MTRLSQPLVSSCVHRRLHLLASGSAGLFLAPQTTGEAIKGGRLVAEVMTRLGFKAVPGPEPGLPKPPSMITAVEMGSREGMVAFCKGIQLACPVGSYIRPEPGERCFSCVLYLCSKTCGMQLASRV